MLNSPASALSESWDIPASTRRHLKEVKTMKTKLLSLAVAVLGTPILAHAVTRPTPPDAFCAHVPAPVIAAINAVLTGLGFPPIC